MDTETIPRASRPALEVRDLVKVYGGTVAFRGISFSVNQGHIHGLVGENGAGKSTLVRIVSGIERQDSGSVRLTDEAAGQSDSPGADDLFDSSRVAVIHQNLALVESLSVAENIALAAGYSKRGPVIGWRATRRRAREALDRLGVELNLDDDVGLLSIAQRTIVAIARALALRAPVLLLDEPTASLQASEVRTLFEILYRLRDSGMTCLFVSHRIDEVLTVCDRVTVLRDGAVVSTTDTSELTEEKLVELILGRAEKLPTRGRQPATRVRPLLEARSLVTAGLGPLDFAVHAGEILGVTGLAGAGHLAFAECLFGLLPLVSGTMLLGGEPYSPQRPADAIAAGVAYVPADRHAAGIAERMTARENLFLNPGQKWWHLLRARKEERTASELLVAFDVRPPLPDQELSAFSGGNQQKIVLARWLSQPRRLLVLAEPTVGVDIGAKSEIYGVLRRSCSTRESGVVMASSDFEEVALVADRALVLNPGGGAVLLEREQLSVDSVTAAAYASRSLTAV